MEYGNGTKDNKHNFRHGQCRRMTDLRGRKPEEVTNYTNEPSRIAAVAEARDSSFYTRGEVF